MSDPCTLKPWLKHYDDHVPPSLNYSNKTYPEYIKEFEEVVGEGKLVEVLGITETSPVHMGLPRYGMKKPGSVGIPFPDTEVK